MTTQPILNHWKNGLLPGSPNDSRLLHSDPSDRILVYPSCLGQGYRQEIWLRDDLSLFILDYTLSQDVIFDALGKGDYLKFEFQLAETNTRYSNWIPQLGFRSLGGTPARKRVFEVEVVFKRPASITYTQAFLDRLPSQTQHIVERISKFLRRHQGGCSNLTLTGFFDHTEDCAIAPYADLTLGHLLSDALYFETVDLTYAARSPITPAMEQAIGRILSCPYQGKTRRTYLERQALALVALRLEAIAQPGLNAADLNCIYQAASVLRNQIANPPTVEVLARQVGTNRLKLNQGFHEVYGTTPFGYLRDCRLMQAYRLLTTSDLSIGKVAATVGYASRNHFAKAFRRQIGVNPKTFQMQAWKCAS